MSKSLVSIIIPTYNRAARLAQTLESVRQQTHSKWEAIVVDDGSSDGTAELFQAGRQDQRVRYIPRPNGGVAAARNTGLRAAQGEFIAFLDSDDLWRPWKLELQVNTLRQNRDIGMVWTDMEAIDSCDRLLESAYLRQFYSSYRWFSNETLFYEHRTLTFPESGAGCGSQFVHIGEIFSPMLTGNLVHTSTCMLTRGRLEAVRSFDESIRPSGEDYDFHLRTCREGPVGFIDVVSTSYRIGDVDQLTRPQNAAALAEHFIRTVTSALARDAERIEPRYRHLIDDALAEGHMWAAEEQLKTRHNQVARRHLVDSLRIRRDFRAFALLSASLLPGPISGGLRAAYRGIRRHAHGNGPAK